MRRRRLIKWRHSSHCNGGACVEVTQLTDSIAIRDSSYPDRTFVTYSTLAWQYFVKSIKTDEFDTPEVPSL